MNEEAQAYSYDDFNARCIDSRLVFLLLPKKCHLSGKRLWLQTAYKKIAMYTGPGTPVFIFRYYDRTEYLIALLKGEL